MAEKAVIAGSLSFIGLADLFQLLGGNGSTGTLRIKSPYSPHTGLIHFVNGNPANGSCGSLKGIDAIYALFGWTAGEFDFQVEEVKVARTVKTSRMQIVLDALRMLDDGLIRKVGPESLGKLAAESREGNGGNLAVVKGPLVDYMYIVSEQGFKDGERIIAEGGHGKWIWVVLGGKVAISKNTPRGPIPIALLGEGSYIGTTTSFSFQEYVRSATARAVGETHLGLLDSERLYEEYARLTVDFKRLLSSLNNRLKKTTDRALEILEEPGRPYEWKGQEQILMKKGSSQEELFSITGGEAHVVGQTRKGVFPLLRLNRNDVFGYLPFVDLGQEPRSAAVMASKGLQVQRIDVEGIRKEYDALSETFRNMIYNLGTCIYVTTQRAFRLFGGH